MKRIFILAFILLLVMDNIYAGGGNRTGTGGASELLIPVGVRGISMGQTGVATATGIEALFWNPAGISKMDGSANVMFSHMNYIADIGVEYGAVSANFEGFGVVSLSVKSLSVGDIPITTTQNPDGTGSTFSPQLLTTGLTYSKQLTERIAVGLTANLITETLGDATANGVAFNVGVIYDNLGDVNGLSFGVVMKNIGSQMKYSGSALFVQADVNNLNRPPQYYTIDAAGFELPSTFELGLGYRPQIDEMNALTVATTFQNNNFSGDEYKFGLEYGYNNTFFIRGGYSMSPKSQTETFIYDFSAGAGINYSVEGIDLKFDYAYRNVEFFNGNHVFSLTLGF
ncbi:MAG: PorV/PorQ family protein [Ignavibacteriaceae bacterium]